MVGVPYSSTMVSSLCISRTPQHKNHAYRYLHNIEYPGTVPRYSRVPVGTRQYLSTQVPFTVPLSTTTFINEIAVSCVYGCILHVLDTGIAAKPNPQVSVTEIKHPRPAGYL